MPDVTLVGVALKWQARRTLVDPLTGAVRAQELHGASEADLAALEWGLRLAERTGGEVLAVCAGPRAAETLLREALAAGAARALLVEGVPEHASPARAASALAAVLGESDLVVCGVHGLDEGSGAVPAALAAELGAAQALGLVTLELEGDGDQEGELIVVRRLSGGWRERLRVRAPAVLSVEGASAQLRRASLPATLAAGRASVEHHRAAPAEAAEPPRERLRDRPRPRILDAPDPALPAHDRILALTGAGGDGDSGARELVEGQEPAAAARRVLAALRRWQEI
jgi:electron transfer flavoprotein beta subunit